MAVKLLQVLVLGVIAAAAVDDVPVAWVPPPRATLQCQIPDAARIRARGPPPPLESGEERPRAKPYIWRRDGEDLKKSSDGSLDVARRKDPSADGVYQCAVALGRHQGGLVLGYPVNLRFAHLEKQFSVQPANATAWQGQPYALTCDISSGPPANISWIKDGEPLPDDERYQLVNNQLIITEVTRKDAGLYRCRAANAMANKSRTSHGGRLQVEEAPPELGASFLGLQHEEAILVTRGTRVVLPCPVQGMPRPQLIWEHTPPGNQRTGELESTDELLLMPSIAVDQAGVYRCRVVGHLNLTKTFNVTITTPVNITHPPESKQAVRASTVRFNCTASGTPSPEVTWYKDGKLLKLQGRINVVMSADDKRLQQLLIRSVLSEDAGVYQCFARNAASVASAWATLNVTGGEAAPPDDVRCYPVGPHDVVVRWRKLPKDIKVIAYTVQYTHPGEKSYPTQPVTVSEATIDVKSTLTPYSFQVRAYLQTPSGTAVSDMSKSVTCQGQGVPIKLFEASNDSILVSWRDFYVENPGVQQWILQHKPENSSDEHNVTLDGYVYNYTLNVNPLESQQVRVLGTRSLPWLRQNLTLVPWTASSAASRPGPGEVRLVPENVEVTELNPHNFTVRWRCGEEYQCSTYTFKVCTRRVGGYDDCVESSGNYTTVTNLEPNSEYEVRVQAQLPTSQTQGDFSKPIPVSTPRAGQDNFRNISYRVINATAVNVSWDSAQKEYTVWHTYDYSLPLTQWNPVEAVGNSVLLTGLDPTKTLNVRVVGQDPPVQSRLLTIPVQIPEATDVRYSYEGEGVRVQWRGKGPRVVRYSQNLTRPLQTWHRVDVTDTTALITDVEPSLPVFVVVAAPGESARSHVLTIKPRPHAADHYDVYLGISIACGVLVACLLAGVAVFAWRKRKRRTPRRARSRPEGDGTEGEEMNSIGDRLANGGGSKDAGEPLLNGHVHITENPTQSKTPNGKVRKGQRYEEPLDVTRYDDADVTLDTVLDADTSSTTYHLLDTSRRPEFEEIPPNESFSKLPDDNMNSEVTRGEIPLENSKVLPTLQPNG